MAGETPQQTIDNNNGNENEAKLQAVETGIKSLLEGTNENDDQVKNQIRNALDDGFKEWVKNNPNRVTSLKDSVQNFIDEIKKQSYKLNDEDYKNLVELASALGIPVEPSSTTTETVATSETATNLPKPNVGLDLGGEPKEGGDKPTTTLYSELIREKPKEGEPDNNLEGKKLYIASETIENQLSEIGNLLTIDSLKDNKNLKEAETLLNKIKIVINNTTPENVRILQNYICNNLDENRQEEFKRKNHYNTKIRDQFDGQFGESTLEGLNIVLDKIQDYLKSLKPTEQVSGNNQTETETGTETGNATGGESNPGGNGDRVDQVAETTNTTSLSLNGETYSVSPDNQSLISSTRVDGATFYSTVPSSREQTGSDGDSSTEKASESAKKPEECYMILKDRPNNVYKVKLDPSGNLCPVATEIDTTISQNDKYIETSILLANNESCINYISNKVPSGLNCVIGWSNNEQDYFIKSYGLYKSLEPMAISGKWVSEDLGECIALLNFVNYLNSGTNPNLDGKDPDLKWKDDSLYAKTKKGWGKISPDFLANLGLKDIKGDTWKKFIKYNNHEEWEDEWDSKKDNRYYKKISFPSVRVTTATAPTETPTSTVPETPTTVSETEITTETETETTTETETETETTTETETETRDQVPQQELVDNNGSTNEIVKISKDSWMVRDDDFKAMQKFLETDNEKFITLGENGEVSCNLLKTKNYLTKIKDRERDYFKGLKGGEYTAWIVAVQIMLNEWRKKEKGETSSIAVTGELNDGYRFNSNNPYRDKFAYSTRGCITMFQSEQELKGDGLPGKETISKLLEYFSEDNTSNIPSGGIEQVDDNQDGKESPQIKEKLEDFTSSSVVLDLSELTSLTEDNVDQILNGVNAKARDRDFKNRPLTLKLDGLDSLDINVASKLSDWKSLISIDKILEKDMNDSEINILKALVPQGKDAMILAPNETIGEALKQKDIQNVTYLVHRGDN